MIHFQNPNGVMEGHGLRRVWLEKSLSPRKQWTLLRKELWLNISFLFGEKKRRNLKIGEFTTDMQLENKIIFLLATKIFMWGKYRNTLVVLSNLVWFWDKREKNQKGNQMVRLINFDSCI